MMRSGVGGYVLLYPLPGLAFPVGFLVLAYALWRSRAAPAAAAPLVALGALLFPVGRIGGVEAAVMGSGLALTLGMSLTALRLLGAGASEPSHPRPTPSASATRLM